jgi:hypothetical protein
VTVVTAGSCGSEDAFDICSTLPLKRGEVVGTGVVRLRTDGAEGEAAQVRIELYPDDLVVKFCGPHRDQISAAYLVWSLAPESPIPAAVVGANNCGIGSPSFGATVCGNWKTCSAGDCTFDNGVLQFSSYSGLGGSMNASGEVTQWDREAGRLVGWVKFDTIITTFCPDDGTAPPVVCMEQCPNPGLGPPIPCRHDIGKHIEVDVDISWTPPPVDGDLDGGV